MGQGKLVKFDIQIDFSSKKCRALWDMGSMVFIGLEFGGRGIESESERVREKFDQAQTPSYIGGM